MPTNFIFRYISKLSSAEREFVAVNLKAWLNSTGTDTERELVLNPKADADILKVTEFYYMYGFADVFTFNLISDRNS